MTFRNKPMPLSAPLLTMARGPARCKPASQQSIDVIVRELGFPLPLDYQEFLLLSNGFLLGEDPELQNLLLDPIETIVDNSYGYGLDVVEQQAVLIGSDGGPSGYAIDFRFQRPFFVRLDLKDPDRRKFEYLGETLYAFVANVKNNTKEKKPKGIYKRPKKKVGARKVDPNRSPEDPGLALVLKKYQSNSGHSAIFSEKRGHFLFQSNQQLHLLDPRTFQVIEIEAENLSLNLPGAFHPTRNSVVAYCYFPDQHEWSLGEFNQDTRKLEHEIPSLMTIMRYPPILQFSPDGKHLVIVYEDRHLISEGEDGPHRLVRIEGKGGICVYNAETWKLENRFHGWHEGVSGITFSDEGFLVHGYMAITGEHPHFNYHPEIQFRILETGELVRRIKLQEEYVSYHWLRFSHSGKLYAANRELLLCEIHPDGSVTYPLGMRCLPQANSFEVIDNSVLIGMGGGSLHLFDLETGRETWNDRDKRGSCDTVGVSDDGNWVLTGGYNAGPPRLWRLPMRSITP